MARNEDELKSLLDKRHELKAGNLVDSSEYTNLIKNLKGLFSK